MSRWIVLAIVLALVLALVMHSREGFDLPGVSSDAALVCYWAPKPPPGAEPTRPDPRPLSTSEGPGMTDLMQRTTAPMVQETSYKTTLTSPPQTLPPGVLGDVDRKAYAVTPTTPPQADLGVLAVPPTPPPLFAVPTIAPTAAPFAVTPAPVPTSAPQ